MWVALCKRKAPLQSRLRKKPLLSHSVTITARENFFTPLISHSMTTTAGEGLSSYLFLWPLVILSMRLRVLFGATWLLQRGIRIHRFPFSHLSQSARPLIHSSTHRIGARETLTSQLHMETFSTEKPFVGSLSLLPRRLEHLWPRTLLMFPVLTRNFSNIWASFLCENRHLASAWALHLDTRRASQKSTIWQISMLSRVEILSWFKATLLWLLPESRTRPHHNTNYSAIQLGHWACPANIDLSISSATSFPFIFFLLCPPCVTKHFKKKKFAFFVAHFFNPIHSSCLTKNVRKKTETSFTLTPTWEKKSRQKQMRIILLFYFSRKRVAWYKNSYLVLIFLPLEYHWSRPCSDYGSLNRVGPNCQTRTEPRTWNESW